MVMPFMGFPSVWFITPVHKRNALTEICLEQRVDMLRKLPFEAQAVVIGDDENMEVAERLGLHTVRMDNGYVARKFNAGYAYAREHGATHCMGIGSDSWLHESALAGAHWQEHKAIGLIGLSSFSPDGLERLDLGVKYPAGFGVGMVYPAPEMGDEPAEWRKNRGIDTSVWQRIGAGRIPITFQELIPRAYLNFHSQDIQITDFRLLRRAHQKVLGRQRTGDVFEVLEGMYPDELVDRLRGLYAAQGVGVFLTGVKPELETTQKFGSKPRVNKPSRIAGQARRKRLAQEKLDRINGLEEAFEAIQSSPEG